MSNTSASPSKTRTVIDIDDSSDSGGGEDDGEVTFVASRPPPGQPTAASSTSSSPSKRRDGAESSTIEGAQTGLCTQAEGENRAGADELASVVHDVNPPSIASTSSSGRQSSSHAVVVLTSRGPGANLQLQPINTYQRPPSLDQQRGAGAAGAAPLYTVDRERHTITIHATDADRSYWPVREYISGGRVLVRNIAMDGSETARQWSIRCGTGLARLLELGGDDDDADDVQWTLTGWPAGYKMFRKLSEDDDDADYTYLVGSTFLGGRKFRTTKEYTKHLAWLCRYGNDRTQLCQCKHCQIKFNKLGPRNVRVVVRRRLLAPPARRSTDSATVKPRAPATMKKPDIKGKGRAERCEDAGDQEKKEGLQSRSSWTDVIKSGINKAIPSVAKGPLRNWMRPPSPKKLKSPSLTTLRTEPTSSEAMAQDVPVNSLPSPRPKAPRIAGRKSNAIVPPQEVPLLDMPPKSYKADRVSLPSFTRKDGQKENANHGASQVDDDDGDAAPEDQERPSKRQKVLQPRKPKQASASAPDLSPNEIINTRQIDAIKQAGKRAPPAMMMAEGGRLASPSSSTAKQLPHLPSLPRNPAATRLLGKRDRTSTAGPSAQVASSALDEVEAGDNDEDTGNEETVANSRPRRAARNAKVNYRDASPDPNWVPQPLDEDLDESEEEEYNGPYYHKNREEDIIYLGSPYRNRELVWFRLSRPYTDLGDEDATPQIELWPAQILEKHLCHEAHSVPPTQEEIDEYNANPKKASRKIPPLPRLTVRQFHKYEINILNTSSKSRILVENKDLVPWIAYRPPHELLNLQVTKRYLGILTKAEDERHYEDLQQLPFTQLYTLWYHAFLTGNKATNYYIPLYEYLDSPKIKEMIKTAPRPMTAKYKNMLEYQKKIADKYFQAIFWGNEKIWVGEIVRIAATWSIDDKEKQGVDSDDSRTGTRLRLHSYGHPTAQAQQHGKSAASTSKQVEPEPQYIKTEDLMVSLESIGKPVYFRVSTIRREEDTQLVTITGSYWELVEDDTVLRSDARPRGPVTDEDSDEDNDSSGLEDQASVGTGSNRSRRRRSRTVDTGKARPISPDMPLNAAPEDQGEGARSHYKGKFAQLQDKRSGIAATNNQRLELLTSYLKAAYCPQAPKGKMFKPVQVVNRPKHHSWTLPVEMLAGRYYNSGTYAVNRSNEVEVGLAKALGGISKRMFSDTITQPKVTVSRRKEALKQSSKLGEKDLLEYCRLYNPEEYERLRILTPEMEGDSPDTDDDDGRSIGYLDT